MYDNNVKSKKVKDYIACLTAFPYCLSVCFPVKYNIMNISKDLLDVLVCPKCQGKIELIEKENGIVCKKCRLIYPVTEDIPIMLIDSAIPLEE